MKRHHADDSGIEPHVFDQTNGVVDLGAEPDTADERSGRPDIRTTTGIAMLSTQRP